MNNAELKSKVSEFDAERVYARNKAEDCYLKGENMDAKIWEEIESCFSDLVYKLQKYLN